VQTVEADLTVAPVIVLLLVEPTGFLLYQTLILFRWKTKINQQNAQINSGLIYY